MRLAPGGDSTHLCALVIVSILVNKYMNVSYYHLCLFVCVRLRTSWRAPGRPTVGPTTVFFLPLIYIYVYMTYILE